MSWVALLVCMQTLTAAAATAPEPRRIAVVVGANAAVQGRSPLRFAYKDAERMAEVLHEAGRFASADVHLLRDPKPAELLWVIDGALAELAKEPGETLFVLYYSGHSDQASVYPGGDPLPLEQLRTRLDSPSATVRVGVIDACRGGSWTRAKGLTPDAPFQVDVPFGLSSEGSVLISSSSGAENAHESDALEGSFFTHHLVAGMRGAADRSGDGDVSLTEAFGYAQELTVRDSALVAKVPQHPSFDMNLRGRTDLALTRASSAPSIVSVTQSQGPIEVVQLGTGLVVLEMTEGERRVQVALPPGKYVFRRRGSEGMFAREVVVAANSSVELDEGSLVLVGRNDLLSKGFELPPVASLTTLPARTMQIAVQIGLRQDDVNFGGDIGPIRFAPEATFSWGITDRLQLGLLSASYRLGERGSVEWVPFLAAVPRFIWPGDLVHEAIEGQVTLAAGVGARFWFHANHAINATANVASPAQFGSVVIAPTEWFAKASVGYSGFFGSRVAINIGVGYSQFLVHNGSGPRGLGSAFSAPMIAIGSVQSLGLRELPLLSFQVSDWFAVELHAAALFTPRTGAGGVTVTAGTAFTF